MRQLMPVAADHVDPLAVHGSIVRTPPPDRPWVLSDFVASLDGAVALAGTSGGLASPGDREVFMTLRTVADVVVVGAETVRAERYGPVRLTEARRAWRRDRDLPEVPPIAVVTRSLLLDYGSPLFTDATVPPIVLTCESAPAGLRREAEAVADVLVAGTDRVDLGAALGELRSRGHRVALTEGGPTLHGELLAGGLLDEVCLTVAPLVAGGPIEPTLVAARALAEPRRLDLTHLLSEDGYLFARYLLT